jgi:glutamate-ammonia-ligase adenylyltransferase
MLETRMTLGILYNVDMRLRPSGNSGLLVSSFSAFERYQLQEAWTWEHQALSRARVVAGDSRLAKDFQEIRLKVLSQPREMLALAAEVKSMRQKMRENLDTDIKGDSFNLKHGFGGIVDIEFMVQYALLAQSAAQPSLAAYTDNIRQLEALVSCGLISVTVANELSQAYLAYRSATHECALQEEPGVVSGPQWNQHREAVGRIWHDWFNSNCWE